ncbi:MAG: TatD family hydrolase, partial [Spirochaetales bacterium]
SEELLETALDCGFWISFAGNLTYKSNDHLRRMLKKVPRNKLLLETDAPYLTPVPLRGKPNCPANIIHTYECAAQVLGISVEQLSEQVFENFTCFV